MAENLILKDHLLSAVSCEYKSCCVLFFDKISLQAS